MLDQCQTEPYNLLAWDISRQYQSDEEALYWIERRASQCVRPSLNMALCAAVHARFPRSIKALRARDAELPPMDYYAGDGGERILSDTWKRIATYQAKPLLDHGGIPTTRSYEFIHNLYQGRVNARRSICAFIIAARRQGVLLKPLIIMVAMQLWGCTRFDEVWVYPGKK